MLIEMKNRPCMDCGGTFDPVCMDFDHRPGAPKIDAVGAIASKGQIAKFIAEAAKCDVVCANCHRLRTFRHRDHSAISNGKATRATATPQLDLTLDGAWDGNPVVMQ